LACGLPQADVFGPARSPDLPDWCTPLDHPRWVTPPEASLMRDDDPILGFEAAGHVWAIPWWVMKNHHCANLTLEGRPFLVTLCEMCVAGGVFDPTLEGRPTWFQMNGWYNHSPLMTDGLTGGLWALIHGRCVAGPLRGTALPMRPIVHARWRQWAAMYPQTLVAHGEGEPRDGHGAEMWGPGHQLGRAEIRGIGSNELVVGVELGESRRAYLLTALHDQGGIIEDVLDGRPIVVVTLPGTWVCVTFVPELDGTRVRLQWDRQEDPSTHLVDRTSGWRFDLWGRCLTDEHRDVGLPYVRSSLKKWGRWVMVNPDAELWQGGRAPATIS
jgi:hypothetical protein